MKAEPLKDKEYLYKNSKGKIIESSMFRKDDVASAVAWLKKEIKENAFTEDNYTIINEYTVISLIDEAFEDATKK